MENTRERLNDAIKDAMKTKDAQRRDVLRLLTSAIKQVEIDMQAALSEEQVQEVLQKEAKKRRESISELTAAGRSEQAAAEQYELGVLEEFLPRQLDEDELRALIRQAIADSGAQDGREMGRVMALVQPQTKGRADGRLVSQLVKELLG